MDKSGTFIGARMGRPEKAKMRKLTGSPQVLFPIGDEGGRLRSFQAAIEAGKVTADLPVYKCKDCVKNTIYPICEECGKATMRLYLCPRCGLTNSKKCEHGSGQPYMRQEVDIKHYFQKALDKLEYKVYPDLIKGVRGTMNRDHTPEHIIKGILRARHEVFVNKDGTIRFDMSELPVTHFKPKEINIPLEKLPEIGYTHDIKGKEIKDREQILELKPQDIILPAASAALDEQSDIVLHRVANFVDELLVKLYGLEP